MRRTVAFAALALAAALGTGAASAASASAGVVTQPLSLSISPASFHIAPGQSARLQVTDTGTLPLQVNTLVALVTPTCSVGHSQVTWASVTPSSLSLQPGESASLVASVASSVPAGGTDLAVTAETDPSTHLITGVASQMLVTQATTPAKPCVAPGSHHHPAAARARPSTATGAPRTSAAVAAVAGVMLLLSLVGLLGTAWWAGQRYRRWRRRRVLKSLDQTKRAAARAREPVGAHRKH